MKRRSLLLAALAAPLAVAGATFAPPAPAQAATWTSSDRWGSWNNSGYTLYNNIWGSGYGPQTIWANSYNNWGVWANHPNTGGIKSYPNVSYNLGRDVWNMGNVNSQANVTVPSGSSSRSPRAPTRGSTSPPTASGWSARTGCHGCGSTRSSSAGRSPRPRAAATSG
jgi:hypothetical protein